MSFYLRLAAIDVSVSVVSRPWDRSSACPTERVCRLPTNVLLRAVSKTPVAKLWWSKPVCI